MGSRVGPWAVEGRSYRLKKFAGQGLTTLTTPGGRSRRVYRGSWSIPLRLRREGRWVHVGDPGASRGHLFDPYQGQPGATSKLFLVRTPSRQRYRYEHPLEPDERMNNSFAAVSPDGLWLVSGEWDTMQRLLVFPTPLLNPASPPPGRPLPLAATIELDRPVRNVQGATFVGPATLLLASDDRQGDLWPVTHPLLELTLPAPLDGMTVRASVALLGQLPLHSWCSGEFETEGIDYDEATGDLRVTVVPPGRCALLVTIYRLHRSTG